MAVMYIFITKNNLGGGGYWMQKRVQLRKDKYKILDIVYFSCQRLKLVVPVFVLAIDNKFSNYVDDNNLDTKYMCNCSYLVMYLT